MNLADDLGAEDLKVFLDEAEEQLQLLDEDIVALERQDANAELLQEIFRAAHTLKGSSAMLGYQEMADLGHAMESLLDKVRKGTLLPSTTVVDALLHSLDVLRSLKDALIEPSADEIDVTTVVAELNEATKAEEPPDAAVAATAGGSRRPLELSAGQDASVREHLGQGHRSYRVCATLAESCAWSAVRWFQVLGELSELGEVIASSPTREQIESESAGPSFEAVIAGKAEAAAARSAVAGVAEVVSATVTEYVPGDAPAGAGRAPDDTAAPRGANRGPQTIRVDVERLDHVMNVIGELVIDRTRIQQIGKQLEGIYKDDELIEGLGKTSAHIVKVVNELQDRIMQIRMLPIGTVFGGFPRMVRDLAQGLGKQVDFIVQGQDTEIDRTVIERVRDPLVHLLRNAVDHGLESPQERRAAGKPEQGTLRLSAYHEQGHIVVAVKDDGKGIDAEALKASAVRKGLLSDAAVAKLSHTEALDLVFMPGNSTAARATDVSGRGVGMDIVKANIEAINGFVHLRTEPGAGTEFLLRLPLTLATVQSLLVGWRERVFAIPLVYVLETRRVARDEIHVVNHREVFTLRGQVLPLVRLEAALGEDAGRDAREGDGYVITVQAGETRLGLAVDLVLEPQEVVVKSLGRYIGEVRGVAGASILGDGRVALIVDVPSLINTLKRRQIARAASFGASGEAAVRAAGGGGAAEPARPNGPVGVAA